MTDDPTGVSVEEIEDTGQAEHDPSDRDIGRDDLKALLETERRQKEQEQRRREQAEARAASAERERDEAHTGRQTDIQARYESELAAAAAAIAAGTAEADRLEREAEAAYAEGKFAEALKAQRRMAAIEAETVGHRGREKWLKDNKDAILAQSKPQQRQATGINLDAYTAPQRRWIEDNPAYKTDERFRSRTAALHYEAVAEGIMVDTPEYFAFIDDGLKARRQTGRSRVADDGDDTREPPPARPARRAAADDAPVMPVQRRAAEGGSASSNGVIRLTADEREAADFMMADVPPQDWRDAQGIVQPGRYKRYAMRRDEMKRKGLM